MIKLLFFYSTISVSQTAIPSLTYIRSIVGGDVFFKKLFLVYMYKTHAGP